MPKAINMSLTSSNPIKRKRYSRWPRLLDARYSLYAGIKFQI